MNKNEEEGDEEERNQRGRNRKYNLAQFREREAKVKVRSSAEAWRRWRRAPGSRFLALAGYVVCPCYLLWHPIHTLSPLPIVFLKSEECQLSGSTRADLSLWLPVIASSCPRGIVSSTLTRMRGGRAPEKSEGGFPCLSRLILDLLELLPTILYESIHGAILD